jgi:hypothetical protein
MQLSVVRWSGRGGEEEEEERREGGEEEEEERGGTNSFDRRQRDRSRSGEPAE